MDAIDGALLGFVAGFLLGSSILGLIFHRMISRMKIDLREAQAGFATAEILRAQDRYERAGVMDQHPFTKPRLQPRPRTAPPFLRRWFSAK